jgi:uncharacterized protein YjbI with pentapeptide repeats
MLYWYRTESFSVLQAEYKPMPNQDHLDILHQGSQAWNKWRYQNPEIRPDLSAADLQGFKPIMPGFDDIDALLGSLSLNLSKVDLRDADLRQAKLSHADLSHSDLWNARFDNADLGWADLGGANASTASFKQANLRNAKLIGASFNGARLNQADLNNTDFWNAYLVGADLSLATLRKASFVEANLRDTRLRGADLTLATMRGADLSRADLEGANLWGANLSQTVLVETNFAGATLSHSKVYSIAAWNVNLSESIQRDIVITRKNEPVITVDDLEVAQFLYLLLNNSKIRNVIDTITAKAVLILGRFTGERKKVLDALRDELRDRDYLPILFDFEKPAGRDLTEMISTLAHLSRFIIADVTDAKSIPQELQAIVPNLPSVPVRLIIQKDAAEYAMLPHFKRYPWVIETYQYQDSQQLLASLIEHVIQPAEKKVIELQQL